MLRGVLVLHSCSWEDVENERLIGNPVPGWLGAIGVHFLWMICQFDEKWITQPFGSTSVKRLYFSLILKMWIGKLSSCSVRRINLSLVMSCSGLLSMIIKSWVPYVPGGPSVSALGGWSKIVVIWASRNSQATPHTTLYQVRRKLPSNTDVLGTLVQACSSLFKLAQACSNLFKLVQTSSNLFKLVHTSSNLFKLVQTCSNLFKLVTTYSNLFKLAQTCSNLIRLDQIGSMWCKMDQLGSNLIKLDQKGSMWCKMDQIGSNLIKLEQT